MKKEVEFLHEECFRDVFEHFGKEKERRSAKAVNRFRTTLFSSSEIVLTVASAAKTVQSYIESHFAAFERR